MHAKLSHCRLRPNIVTLGQIVNASEASTSGKMPMPVCPDPRGTLGA